MKHLWKWTACVILVFAATVLASAQESLGDVARQERARPKPHAAKVITNDDIPSVDTSSDSATPADKKAPDAEADSKDKDKDKDKDKNKAKDKEKDKDKDNPLSAEEKIQLMEKWKGKIAAQEGAVKQLDDQVAQIDRDYKLRMSALYADLGNRLRDQAQWAADEKKFQEDMAAKEKERDAARDKLNSMKDEARRDGVEGIE